MRHILKIFSLFQFLVVTGISQVKASEDPMIEKSKSYTKTYTIGNDKVILNNSFGELQINTWNNNEIKVEISMTAKAETETRAQELLDRIKIYDNKNNGEISFKTEFDHNNDHGKGNHNNTYGNGKNGEKHNEENFKVNYVVHIPSTAHLDATNSFGALKIGDYNGPLNIHSKFGSLTAGKLSKTEHVTIEFGKGVVDRINGGELTVKFSRAEVKQLSGDIRVTLEFANGVKLNLDNEVKKFTLQTKYTTVYLDASNDLSADFDIRSKFGSFSNNTNFNIKEDKKSNDDRYVPKMVKNYTGKSGSGSMEVKINNDFGHVILAHNVSFDVNAKKGEK